MDIQTYRAFEGPAWRWRIAERIAQAERPSPLQGEDEMIDLAIEFARNPDPDKYGTIAQAAELWKNTGIVHLLKILLLGECPVDEIATRMTTSAEVIETFESLFFNISSSRSATGWINSHVVFPEQERGRHDLASRYVMAFYGGPVVARMIADATPNLPWNEGMRIQEFELQWSLKVREALTKPMGDPHEIIKLWLDHQIAMEKIQLQKKRLEQQCVEADRRHKVQQYRQEQSQKKEERRAARERQRTTERELKRTGEQRIREHMERKYLKNKEAARTRTTTSPLAKLRWRKGPRFRRKSA